LRNITKQIYSFTITDKDDFPSFTRRPFNKTTIKTQVIFPTLKLYNNRILKNLKIWAELIARARPLDTLDASKKWN
jgi:hypothetical protein